MLILGDSLEILPRIEAEFDASITDPPYNISGYDNKKDIGWLKSNSYWQGEKKFTKMNEDWDKFSNGDYLEFTSKWLDSVCRLVRPNGNIMIFGTYHNIYKIGYTLEKLDRKIVNSIVWYKRNAFPNITQRMLCESTEHVIWAVNNNQKDAKNWTFNYDILKKMNNENSGQRDCGFGWRGSLFCRPDQRSRVSDGNRCYRRLRRIDTNGI